jgi:hypothetical protein
MNALSFRSAQSPLANIRLSSATGISGIDLKAIRGFPKMRLDQQARQCRLRVNRVYFKRFAERPLIP